MPDARGVSNTLGFIVLFSIVLASIGIVGTVGFDNLQTARDGTVELNAANSMENIQETVQGLRADNTTLRSVLLRTGGGTVRPDTQPRRVRVDIGDDGSFELDRQTRPLVFEFQDTELVYEAGAVVRVEGDGQFPVAAPEWSERPNSVILPVISSSALEPDRSVSGKTIAGFFQKTDASLIERSTTPESVRIEIETTPQRAEAWRSMVDREMINPDSCSGSGGTVSCVWTRQNVIVRHVHVRYELVT